MPAGSKILPLRSNIPEISKYCFSAVDETFPQRALDLGSSVIVGGSNYGQGSSREHAALAPLYLGIKAVIVKSFARIHKANLVNAGILPLTFENEADYDKISQSDTLEFSDLRNAVAKDSVIYATLSSTGEKIPLNLELSERERKIILEGGLLDYTRELL